MPASALEMVVKLSSFIKCLPFSTATWTFFFFFLFPSNGEYLLYRSSFNFSVHVCWFSASRWVVWASVFLFHSFISLVGKAISKRSQWTLNVKSEELQKWDLYERRILMVELTGFPETPAKCDYLQWHRADRLPWELTEEFNAAGC